MIRRKIETFDDKAKDLPPVNGSDLGNDHNQIVSISQPHNSPQLIGSEHVSLGAPSPSVTIAEVEQWRVDNVVFMDFCKKIGKAFSNYFNENIRFNMDDEVHICSRFHWDYLTFYLIDHAVQDAESQLSWYFEFP